MSKELANGIVFCDVRSFLTGKRLVSLPFSDHCDALVWSDEELHALVKGLHSELDREGWKYVEFRFPQATWNAENTDLAACDSFALHVIDLQRDADEIFRSMHKSSVRDRVRRAEREGVTYKHGRSESLLKSFYQLLLATRRRHGIPPQPFAWFRNLTRSLGDNLDVYVASKGGRQIASIITLSFKNTSVYKYGCSDSHFHNLGGMPFLLWASIQDAKKNGMLKYDMGRTELNNTSLMEFKERLGATPTALKYYRFPAHTRTSAGGVTQRTLRKLVSSSPDIVLKFLGEQL
jgi:predicted N-acyltransferase